MLQFKQSPINIVRSEVQDLDQEVVFNYSKECFTVEDTGLNISLIPATTHNYIIKHGMKFTLNEVHFHRPSEHHVDDQQFDMEMHLVHGGDHETVVYSLLLQMTADGETFGNPFSNIGNTIEINLSKYIPETCWDYHGSLTTSPFEEVVIWLINQQLINIDETEASLLNSYYPNNNRCLQPVNNRDVYTVCNCHQ